VLRIEPFKAEHFFQVQGREAPVDESFEWVARLYEDRSYYARADGTMGRSAFSAWDGDVILGCAGVVLMMGIGEMWARISQELADKPLWLHRTACKLFALVQHEAKIWRFETVIPLYAKTSRNWVRRLGFEYEGTALNYGPNREPYGRYVCHKL
jgi:hypothetical protein